MTPLLIDTNVVSILFKPDHHLRAACVSLLGNHQLLISFMTRSELLLWPVRNNWGDRRLRGLRDHLDLYTTLYPDVETCERWVEVSIRCKRSGRPMGAGDVWIAAQLYNGACRWSRTITGTSSICRNSRYFPFAKQPATDARPPVVRRFDVDDWRRHQGRVRLRRDG